MMGASSTSSSPKMLSPPLQPQPFVGGGGGGFHPFVGGGGGRHPFVGGVGGGRHPLVGGGGCGRHPFVGGGRGGSSQPHPPGLHSTTTNIDMKMERICKDLSTLIMNDFRSILMQIIVLTKTLILKTCKVQKLRES